MARNDFFNGLLEPLGILVHGDTAVVHHRIQQTRVSKDGSESDGLSNWTDVLVKEDGRWLLISDHGGEVPSDASPADTGESITTDAEGEAPLGCKIRCSSTSPGIGF